MKRARQEWRSDRPRSRFRIGRRGGGSRRFSPVMYIQVGFIPLINAGPLLADSLTLFQSGHTRWAVIRGAECAGCLLWSIFFLWKAYRLRMQNLRGEA